MTEFEHDEIQDMIDKAVKKAIAAHEMRVALISGMLGIAGLLFYTHGVVCLVHKLVP